jgi:methionine sulfoxide reductase heme-binding subunit
MVEFVMSNLGVLFVPFLVVILYFLGDHLKKYSSFYLLATLIFSIIIIFFHSILKLELMIIDMSIVSGHLSLALFLLVIFAGVFSQNSILRMTLSKARGEVAVMAFIFLLPHAYSRLSMALSGYNSTGLVAFVLFIPLVLTSFMFFKKRMKAKHWKTLHKLSYVTYFMIYIHLAFDIWLGDTFSIRFSAYSIIYHFIFVGYFVLRFQHLLLLKKPTS